MTTLAAALTNSATEMRVNAAVADPAEYYTIDSEVIRVLANSTTVQDGLSPERSVDTTLWQIQRGHGPTAAASHLSGATLTPFPGAGGGAGGVTVDNTIDAPAEVTSIVAAGATIVGDEATLRGKDFYAQDDDPGAVGAGSVWKDTSTEPSYAVWWKRNGTDTGWLPHFSPYAVGSLDVDSDAHPEARASGTGNAVAGSIATTEGSGTADAHPFAQTEDGIARAASEAIAAGGGAYAGPTANAAAGTADVIARALVSSGTAYAGSEAEHQNSGAKAGMLAEADGTSARMAFNGVTPIAQPVIPAVPDAQDIADVLVALGLATQTP